MIPKTLSIIILSIVCLAGRAQVNDVATPLHLMNPEYPHAYGAPKVKETKQVLNRVYDYLEQVSLAKLIDKKTGKELSAFSKVDQNSIMKPGDYLFVEFAHNDQKPRGNYVDVYSSYQEELMFFITEARKKGGKPVLVTLTNRRKFDENGKIENTLEEYPNAMRQLAAKENISLIDLNAMSKDLYEALGVEDSQKAFVHYPANTFSNQTEPLADNTHFNPYGAYELGKYVVQ